MNNSFLKQEPGIVEVPTILRERKTELTRIIEAINLLAKSTEWQDLKDLVFDKQLEKIKRGLQLEVEKNELQPANIYRLQGQLVWARRYSDLYKLAEIYKVELNSITKKLNENA